MAKKTEHQLLIEIGGKVDSSLNKSVSDIRGKLDKVGKTMKAVAGVAATAFATVKVKDWIDTTTDASKEFGTSMAGVAKVVDGLKNDNGKVTKSYYEMKDAILDMSEDLPKTAKDIAAIMEAAGQSNIAKNELSEFAEDATKMGIAFDATAEQAGAWMAAWRTALNLDQDGVVKLSDQINYLGNTTSENAIKISEVITRVGALAGTAGISASSVAALAASMTKVESEVSATGIKNFSLALVAGESATKRQVKSFKELGLEAGKVAGAMQTDSKNTIIDVLERINTLDKEKQTSVMKNLFGSESLASIAPLVANLDNLKAQFNKVGDSALYAGSMEQEYIAASSTAANVDVLRDNKIKAMQIRVGDALMPLSTFASETTGNLAKTFGNFVENNAPAISRAVQNIEERFKESLPNIAYGLKSFAKNGLEFFNGLRPAFELIEENPSMIPNFLKSTGAALVTYKISKNLSEIAKGAKLAGSPLKYLSSIITNPWALAIGATAAGITMVAKSIASAKKELREADLASRFGNITLSLEDLNSLAKEMLYTDNIGKLSEAMKARDGLDSLSASIDETIAQMNKLNWKVGIGLKLTKEEEDSYKNSVTSFISNTQQLLDDNYYALSLSLEVLTNNDEIGQKIREDASQYYLKKQTELKNLGKQFFDAVQEGFADGVLTIDEAKTISEFQQQMASITSKLAQSKFEASLEVMQTKLGTDLTPESYKNLIAEMQEQADSAVSDYDSSLQMNLAYSKVRLEEGEINQFQYDNEVATYKENYAKAVDELHATISDFATGTAFKGYDKEILKALPALDKEISSIFGSYKEDIQRYLKEEDYGSVGVQFEKMFFDIKNLGILSKEEQKNLKELYIEVIPTKDELEKRAKGYIEANKEIPETIKKQLDDINILGALGGDKESIYSLLGAKIGEDEEYESLLEKVDKIGIDLVPDKLLNAIDSKMPDLLAKTKEIKSTITTELQKGLTAVIPVSFEISKRVFQSDIFTKEQNNSGKGILNSLNGHKDGGIFDTPHIAWFAEDGPEAVLPLDGSKNAIELWQMVGQILGMFDLSPEHKNRKNYIPESYQQLVNTTSNNNNVNNAPTFHVEYQINVEKGADTEKVQQAVTMSQAQFDYMISVYEKNKFRTNMGG